jgi:hypothetical protein
MYTQLVSNGVQLDPERVGRLQPSNPNEPIEALREQYAAQGYLWLRGLLDRRAVFAFRRRYFAAFADTPLLAPGSDPVDGIYSGEPLPNFNPLIAQIVRWAAYESFCLSAPIIDFYERFVESPVYLHKRKLIRHYVPHDPHTTGAHYDLVYLRGGTERIYTSWIPLGDTPVEMGGLIYLENSATWGRSMEARFSEMNRALPPEERVSAYNRNMNSGWLRKDVQELARELDTCWLVADYEAGDMVIHNPYMIHASTVNTDAQNRIRLSTDIRYQRVSDAIDTRWGEHWSPDDKL